MILPMARFLLHVSAFQGVLHRLLLLLFPWSLNPLLPSLASPPELSRRCVKRGSLQTCDEWLVNYCLSAASPSLFLSFVILEPLLTTFPTGLLGGLSQWEREPRSCEARGGRRVLLLPVYGAHLCFFTLSVTLASSRNIWFQFIYLTLSEPALWCPP